MIGSDNSKYIHISDIPLLCQSYCKIKDPQKLEIKINDFASGGINRLQAVLDFDYTITKQRTEDGIEVPSSYLMIEYCKSLPSSVVEECDKLRKKHRPLNLDPHVSLEDKTKNAIEWSIKTANILVGFPFDEREIDEIAFKYKDSLRDRSREYFNLLNELNIPVLVFSAGLGNAVVSVMKHAQVYYPNIKVISNFLRYKNGMLNGIQEPLIHTMNKNEASLKGTEYYDLVHHRDHIFVIGDSLGDASMGDGVPNSSHIIKIGFLHHRANEFLSKYMDAFDIVLVDDQTMDVPLALLSLISEYHKEVDRKKA